MRKEQIVIGSDIGQRKGVRLFVIVKVMEELVNVSGMLLVMEVCLRIVGYCLTTSRELDSGDEKWSAW
jgi:hypothetical protein